METGQEETEKFENHAGKADSMQGRRAHRFWLIREVCIQAAARSTRVCDESHVRGRLQALNLVSAVPEIILLRGEGLEHLKRVDKGS
jgi:hypothetical protein